MDAQRWEYQLVPYRNFELELLQRELNELGVAGWELVSMSTTVKHVGANVLVATFKRPALGEVDRSAGRSGPDASGWL